MLTELCQYLKNWFDRNQPKYIGEFTIADGTIQTAIEGFHLVDGQYYRIVGSLLNDGVHKAGEADLVDESFSGAVWSMAIPPAIVDLAADIEAWRAKYEDINSEAMSPFNSESFGGYSYSKSGGGASDGTTATGTWQAAFRGRLNPWRKI